MTRVIYTLVAVEVFNLLHLHCTHIFKYGKHFGMYARGNLQDHTIPNYTKPHHKFIAHFHYSSYRFQVAFPGVTLENIELFPDECF